MATHQEKLRRLSHVARRYYLENWNQGDIARELGVSRPMVSRMLSEARERGIVRITVLEPDTDAGLLLERLETACGLRGGILVEDGKDDDDTNRQLSRGAMSLLRQIGAHRLGVGWGHLIGELVAWLEANPQPDSPVTDIFPLVGNASIPARNYQSNENVRLMAQQLGARPHFLYLPALPESMEEKELLCSTEVYHQIKTQWETMDTAIVNIGDYPSSPDFASLVRYGKRLTQAHTCGRLLIYYFNEDGTVIPADQDFAIQIPIETLKKCPNIIGVCSARTSPRALRGALNSGIFHYLVARADLVQSLFRK